MALNLHEICMTACYEIIRNMNPGKASVVFIVCLWLMPLCPRNLALTARGRPPPLAPGPSKAYYVVYTLFVGQSPVTFCIRSQFFRKEYL